MCPYNYCFTKKREAVLCLKLPFCLRERAQKIEYKVD